MNGIREIFFVDFTKKKKKKKMIRYQVGAVFLNSINEYLLIFARELRINYVWRRNY
jgi:hypothetical protein